MSTPDQVTDSPVQDAELLEAAWRKYSADLAAVREMLLSSPFLDRTPHLRPQLYAYLLEQHFLAYVNGVRAEGAQPRLIYQEHDFFTMFLPCPEFFYVQAFLDGRRRYRLRGNRRDTQWFALQVQSSRFGEGSRSMGTIDFDDLGVGLGEDFEVVFSADDPGHSAWIALDPNSPANYLFVRRCLSDWDNGRPAELVLEISDGQPAPATTPTAAEMARRLSWAGDMVRNSTGFWVRRFLNDLYQRLGANQLELIGGGTLRHQATSDFALYGWMIYELEPDEALIIETEVVDCTYWGIHLGDMWQQTHDFYYHHSSLNERQAVADSDGRIRCVVALDDPGVPNWLDPIGIGFGVVLVRWYRAEHEPACGITKVKLADVRAHLPAETPVVTPAERQATIDRRHRSLRRISRI
jgi:hypothetical protein